MKDYLAYGLLTLIFACTSPESDRQPPTSLSDLDTASVAATPEAATPSDIPPPPVPAPDTSDLERTILKQGLINIQSVDPEIQTDVKYSTEDNFMGEDLYGDYAACYLQPVVARMLAQAQQYLHENHPDVDLLIFDCVRPRSVQYKMWELVKGTDKQNYVAPPRSGSMHNYGAAIDLGLIHRDSGLVDMGTPYDFFGRMAQPRHETEFLKKGELSQQQVNNRQILRTAMRKAGFQGILSEWWHFNAFDRDKVRARFRAVE